MRTPELEAALKLADGECVDGHYAMWLDSYGNRFLLDRVAKVLAAEVRRLEADKRRLDWLDKSAMWNALTDIKTWAPPVYRGKAGNEYALRAGVRDAIDRAMEVKP